MEVRNRLSGILPVIDNDPKTAFVYLFLPSDGADAMMDVVANSRMPAFQLHQRRDVLLRNHQDMHGRFGTDVSKSQHGVSFMDDGRRNLFFYDPAK